ncbi:hypothetical protein JI664_12850 [Rhodobacter sp. NTK016B]|uniref:hypothetical protein n=1 Tax=Rhodobacter sp. NTK016B TaxID=2759676 RepID=UPI001A903FAF|nr:hypothetical protein [Rhodobacter sp. NTK016B]MBN8292856.1 hypothetical protein [Rhodobacter sp. NTK016B]
MGYFDRLIDQMAREAADHAPGSFEHEWRRRAAWKYALLADGVPADEWTECPDWFWAETERNAA